MHWSRLLLALAQQDGAADPAAIVRRAVAATEGDSVASVERAWSRRLARDSSDRLALLGLGALAHLSHRDTTALRLYRQVHAGGGDAVGGYAAINAARLLGLRGQWRAADSMAQAGIAAGRRTADGALTGEALVIAAQVRMRTLGGAAALATLDSADAVIPAGAPRVLALGRCTRAQTLSFAGDTTAVSLALTGAELAARAPDQRTRATCVTVAAGELARRGSLDSALVLYGNVVAAYRAARDRAGLAVALQWRSHLYRQVGWLAKARRDAEEAISAAEGSGATVVIPWARTTLALVALSLGDVAAAAPQASEAARLFDAQGDGFGATTARGLAGGLAAAVGDWEAARSAFTASLERARALGWADAEVTMHESLMHLGLWEGDLATAERELAAARALARTRGMAGRDAALEYSAGVVALRAGRLADAERIFRGRAGRLLQDQPQVRYLNSARLAEVLARRGRIAETERLMGEAATALDDWRAQLRDRELRLLAFQVAEDRSDPDLGVATVVSALASAYRMAAAFDIAERARGRDLADRLTRAAASDTAAGDRATRSGPVVSAAELLEALPDDSTVLLYYVTGTGGEPTTLLQYSWRSVWQHRLAPVDSLAPLVARLGALLEAGEDPAPVTRALAQALLHPILGHLDPAIRRIVIVPDGALHRVPFDLLPLDDGRYAVERFAISIAPSATVAVRLWQRDRSARPNGLLVVADPAFAGETSTPSDALDVLRSAFASRSGLPRLRGSGREGRLVARYADGALVRRRRAASEAWLKRTALDSYGVVHFATHALVDDVTSTNSALALAPGEGEDGFASPGELAALRFNAELVVLSACRTAGGPIVRGEGVQGLAAPLLAAGARAVAVTWWPIGDLTAIPLVERFYSEMARGAGASDALRAAKLAAIAAGAPAREWAAFTIVGDPLARPALRVPQRGPPVAAFAGLAFVLLAAAYWVVVIRKRRNTERG